MSTKRWRKSFASTISARICSLGLVEQGGKFLVRFFQICFLLRWRFLRLLLGDGLRRWLSKRRQLRFINGTNRHRLRNFFLSRRNRRRQSLKDSVRSDFF